MAEQAPTATLQRRASSAQTIQRLDLSLEVEHAMALAKLQVLGPTADERFAELVGFAAPEPRNQIGQGSLTCAWMAPGEWLLLGDEPEIVGLLARIAEQNAADALAVDIGHARTSFLLSGPDARGAIAAHCPLDLWPSVFPVDAVARAPLGDAVMFIARLPDASSGPCFRIIVDQSVEAYAARMLAGPMPRRGEQH